MFYTELPWDHPLSEELEFVAWRDGDTNRGLWLRLDPLPLGFLRKVLHTQPSKRAAVPAIRGHLWFKKHFKDGGEFRKKITLLSRIL